MKIHPSVTPERPQWRQPSNEASTTSLEHRINPGFCIRCGGISARLRRLASKPEVPANATSTCEMPGGLRRAARTYQASTAPASC